MGIAEFVVPLWHDYQSVTSILKLKRELIRHQKLDAGGLARLQEAKLRDLLRYARENSPFYRRLYEGLDIERCRLSDLPVITKRMMMDNYDELVTDRRLNRRDLHDFLSRPENAGKLYKDGFVILNSSGTTGEKAIMGYAWEEFKHVFAAAMARGSATAGSGLNIVKSLFGKPIRIANIMLTNSHSASFICASMLSVNPDHPLMKIRFHSVFLPMDQLCAALNEFQPHLIQAYSTVLGALAYEQRAGRLKLRFDDPRSQLVSLSEPLSEKTRQVVREAFGRDIINTYGACESIIMARECEAHRGMHINTDLVIFEVVDEHDRPVPPGKTGTKVIVTNLYTKAQPMIRYVIHDRVCIDPEPCVCGNRLPLIRTVEGRTEEILFISRPGGGYEPVHPYLFLVPVLNSQGIKEFQVEQVGRDHIIFRVVPEQPGMFTPQDLVAIMERNMEREGFAGRLTFTGEILEKIPRDPVSGKVVQVISKVGPPAGEL